MTVAVGDSRVLLAVDGVSRTQIVQYAGASGDFSPLHTDEPAARAAHPSLMAHGMMTMAMTGRLVTEWFGTGAVRSLSSRFTAPVWPGDELTVTGKVTGIEADLVTLALETRNAAGQSVLVGYATVVIDTLSESA